MTNPKVSVVIPCLNEEDGIASCIEKAKNALTKEGLSFEIVVADNGSTDRTVEVALQAGARVEHQSIRGYGAAYQKGFQAARGEWIIMGDGDDTYDFSMIGPFLRELEKGNELVMGSRFRGKIHDGAMPWLHRYVGNPVLSGILNLLFGLKISDSHCGMRAMTKDAFNRMGLVTTGMEFASEMVIKSAQAGLKISEVAIEYHPRLGESKLRSFRDGWRHLRFMLLYSPGHLFFLPGLLFSILGWSMLLGLLGGPVTLWGVTMDYHYMFIGSLLALTGAQVFQLGILGKIFAKRERLNPQPEPVIDWVGRNFTVDLGFVISALMLCVGFVAFASIWWMWMGGAFLPALATRIGILGLTILFLGLQVLFTTALWGIMKIEYVPPFLRSELHLSGPSDKKEDTGLKKS